LRWKIYLENLEIFYAESFILQADHTELFSLALFRSVFQKYDTRCYFNVRSKADISQLNLPHGNRQIKSVKTEKLKSKKTDMLRSNVNSLGNPYSET